MFLVVGSVNVDLVSYVEHFPLPGETIQGREFHVYQGGKGANQAVGVAKLGGEISLFGYVGDDFFGDFVISELKKVGVDVSNVKKANVPTGVASILVDIEGKNSIILNAGANAFLDAKAIETSVELFNGKSYLLLQLETPIGGVIRACKIAKEKGLTVILDPAPAVKLPDQLLENVDYLTPNEIEIEGITDGGNLGERIENLEKSGTHVVVKAGEKGVFFLKNGKLNNIKAFEVNAIDTTGAGDCFNAAFAVALSREMAFEDACVFAMAAAALSVQRTGAARSFPHLSEVNEFLRKVDTR